jgi:Collagen triple helix repeat (20 copies)
MFSAIRKRFTYANVAMTLALVFAMSGGAYAASKYLITSTKQISPKVLKSLQGRAGKAGANGAQGLAGAQGPAGAQGAQGPQGSAGAKGETGAPGPEGKKGENGTTGFTSTLPKGKTLKGDWAVNIQSAPVGLLIAGVSFGIPLEGAPIPVYVKAKEAAPEHCTGSVTEPGAEAGYLCVFAKEEEHLVSEAELGGVGNTNPKICSGSDSRPIGACAVGLLSESGADPTGFDVTVVAEQGGFALGTWAVTAE